MTYCLNENTRLFYYVLLGTDGHYLEVNAHYANSLGYDKDDILGRPFAVSMHPDDVETCLNLCRQCLTEPSKSFLTTIRKHDGKGNYIYTHWEFQYHTDDPRGISCLGYDVSNFEREKKQVEMLMYYYRERQAFRQSHLIRKPLANIMGLANILSTLETENSHILDMLLQSVEELDEELQKLTNGYQ